MKVSRGCSVLVQEVSESEEEEEEEEDCDVMKGEGENTELHGELGGMYKQGSRACMYTLWAMRCRWTVAQLN